jgi:hypothetical protein
VTPTHPLRADRFYQLVINSGTPAGVTDLEHDMLAGNGSTPGTGYAAMLGQGTRLEYTTQAGDQVKLRLKGGGFLDDLLSSSGRGIQLSVVGAVPHRTVLSGTVRNVRGGVAQAYLGPAISGLGSFGDVRVELATPPFQIGQYPFSSGSPASQTRAIPSLSVTPEIASRRRSTRTMNRAFHSFHS